MDNFTATGIAEGWIDCETEAEYLAAWQHLVDTGLAWHLQGWFGRAAKTLIESGAISAPQGENNELQP